MFKITRRKMLSVVSMMLIFMLGKNLIFADNIRENICLNGEWQFVGTTSNETSAIPSSGYATVRVPGSWYYRPLNYTDTNFTSFHKGWYKLPINIPSRWSGKRIKIYFERVNHYALVFINGVKVTPQGHQESFTPFEVDITTFVTLGQQNTLHVYNEDSWRSAIDSNGNETPGQKPALISDGIYMAEYNGYTVPVGDYMSRNSNVYSGVWTGFGDLEKGIWGNVYLRTYNPVYVEDAYIVTSVRQNKKITTRLYLRNDDSTSHTVNVINTVVKDGVDKLTVGDSVQLVTNPDMSTQSKMATTLPITIPARSNVCIEVSKSSWDTNWADPGGPKLWGIGKSKVKNGSSYDYIDYGDPILYFLKTSLTEGGQTVDTKYTRFGFKELWVYNPEDTSDTYSYPNGKYPYHIYLNGKRIFFQAACLDHAHESFTWNRQNIVVLYRSEMARNMNFIRLHCYSPSQIWFDVADELGVLIVPEVHLRNNSNSPSLYCQATNSFTSPYGSASQGSGISNATAKWITNTKQFFRDYVKAHRNHPSIANWSNGNEIFQTFDGTGLKYTYRYGRTKAMVDIVKDTVRVVDPTRKVSSSGRTAYLKFVSPNCSLDTTLYGADEYDFVDARKVFVYEHRIPNDAPYTADQAFSNWATKYKRPVMDSEEELDIVDDDKIDPGMATNNMTLVEQGFWDWAKFFYITESNGDPTVRFTYSSSQRTYTNCGNTIARAAYYQIPRYNTFSVPIRSQWLRPQNLETVFGSGSSSPAIIWPSMSGEGIKAKQLVGGSSRTTYNWFRDDLDLYNTNMVFDAIRDGFANCPPYGAMPKIYEAGWYTDSALAQGLLRLPEVIVTLKNNGVAVPNEYVVVEPVNASKCNPVGVMTDNTGKAWFTLKEDGDYKFVYYSNTSGSNVSTTKTIAYTNYKDWVKGGYSYIDQTITLDMKDMTGADSTPPSPIADLAVSGSATSTSITLQWTAVGDDGTTGTASIYDIRYMAGGTAISEGNFASATQATGEPAPTASGTQQTVTISNLTPNTQYSFAMKVTDDSSNTSVISNIINSQTLPSDDSTPPAAIGNLAAGNATETAITLTWTSTGDDGTTGTASSYDIRYMANTQINSSNFASATQCSNIPTPEASGTNQSLTVGSLNPGTVYYFAMKVADDVPNTSQISNIANSQTQSPDTTAPAAINTLSAGSATETAITLTWTATGDDGTTGTAASYDIRYSTNQITGSNFASATQCSNIPTPAAVGTQETLLVSNLNANTLYYFAIKVADEIPNTSAISNVVNKQTLQTVDILPPAQITNLAASNIYTSSVTLTWTATGDDGTTGTATNYDIRYQTLTITSNNWDTANTCTGEPIPKAAGGSESFVISNLSASTTYYFAIKAADEAQSLSTLSNIASGKTLAPADPIAPATIADLQINNVASDSMQLIWTAVGDDGNGGTASAYDIRYMAGTQITSINWDSAIQCIGEPIPKAAGGSEVFVANQLTSNTMYYFAIKVADEVPNWSAVSNSPNAQTTASSDVIPPAQINTLATSNKTSSSITLTWTAVGDDGTTGTATLYDVKYSNVEITDLDHWLSTSLDVIGEPIPNISGSNESFTVNNLQAGTTYYFAMRVRDEVSSNWSILSNVATGKTNDAVLDTTQPAAIVNLATINPRSTNITLRWTATGDDGTTGTASLYDIRYTVNVPITSNNWSAATPCVGIPAPLAVGNIHTFEVGSLTPDTLYYFAIKVCDDNANWSDISNVANARTASSVVFTSPVSEWNFDEGSGTFSIDASGNNNTASTAGTNVQWVTPGKVGASAVEFDGTNSYLLVNDSAMLAASSGLTIEAWVKADVITTDGSTRRVIEKGVYTLGASNQALFKIYVDGVGKSITYPWTQSDVGQWHHLVGTYDANGGAYNMRLYQDSILVASITVTGTLTNNIDTNAAALFIGAGGTTSNRFDGVIDEVRIYNSALNVEEVVARFNGQTPPADTIPPDPVDTLATSNITATSITLTWTATGDDGNIGKATQNDIRYLANTPIATNVEFDIATQYYGEPEPVTSGLQQSLTITGLTSGTLYYFAIKVGDEVYNFSTLSNIASGTTLGASDDAIAPSAINNLATSNPNLTSVTLTWTASGDDNNVGTALAYDIRYIAGTQITSVNWDSAVQCVGEPAPQAAGSSESFTVNGLAAGTTYYFAIKVGDEAPNWSNVSNSPSAKTLGTSVDTTVPGTISTLSIISVTSTTVSLRWTATGDDGNTGTAAVYDVRYKAGGTITTSNWDALTQCSNEPNPSVAGTVENLIISGLNSDTSYYFGIKVADEAGNLSNISNIASKNTAEAQGSGIPTSVSYMSAIPLDGNKLQISWVASASADVVSYRVYMSTSSTIDYTTPYTTVSSTTTTLILNNLTANQTYNIVVRAVDNSANEDPNTNAIAETAITSVSDVVARLAVPMNGMSISGKKVTLLVDTIVGDISDIGSVKFEYKRIDDTEWTRIPIVTSGLTNPDTSSPYYIQWDVSNLDTGYQYNVRAVVTDNNGVTEKKPGYITVKIGDGGDNTDIVESSNYKYERIDNRRDNVISMVEPTMGQMLYVKISSGNLTSESTRLKISINPAITPALNKNLVLIGYIHEIRLENGQTEFSKDIEILLPYKDTDGDGRIDDKEIGTNKLLVYSCKNLTSVWERESSITVDKTNKVIVIKTKHLSYYAIFAVLSNDLTTAHVYPNPYKPSLGHTNILFTSLTGRTKVQVFDVSGELIYEDEKDTPAGELSWDAKNSKGEPIASGVYIYLITNRNSQTKRGKLAIVR